MRLLVTGGAGFIGSNFVKRQLSENPLKVETVRVLDKLTYAGNLENFTFKERALFEFVEGDICDAKTVDHLISKSDVVVNFAAESHVDRSILDATDFVKTNILGTQILLESSKNHNVKKFVQVSTDEVYGSIDKGSWDEEFSLHPNSPYSASKAGADLLVHAYSKTFGLDVNITRCSNNYGPYQFPEKVIPLFITNIMQGKQIPIYGNGSNVRDWLHVSDHCQGIELVIQHGKSGGTYNIGGGTELSNMQLAGIILEEFKSDNSMINFVPDRLGHDARYSVSISKIAKELNFKPRIDFITGLRDTINFYKENKVWWQKLVK